MANSDGGGWAVLFLIGIGIYSLSGNEEKEAETQLIVDELGVSEDEAAELLSSYGNAQDVIDDTAEDYREPFDEYAAKEAAEDQLASESYNYSYGCTIDCSGHEAGWRWRAENGYSTPGNSQSFHEGGMAFDDAVEDRVDEMRNAYENGEEPY